MENNRLAQVRQRWSLIVVLIVLVAALVFMFARASHQSSKSAAKNLLFANSLKGELYVTDLKGKVVAKMKYPRNSYLSYQAVATDGSLLAALNSNTPSEGFLLIKDNKAKQLPESVAAHLRDSVAINGSHQLALPDSDHVLMVSCQNPNNDCQLMSLDIKSGKAQMLLDIGATMTSPYFPPAYLLDYSPSTSTAFIKVDAKNKLGKSTSSVFLVNAESGKVTQEKKLPVTTGYSFKLSNDQTQAVYYTSDIKGKTTISIRQLATGRETKINWSKGFLANGPEAFVWSPDGSKILTRTLTVTTTTGQTANSSAGNLYIDVPKNQIIGLESDNTRGNTINNQAWSDDGNIIYDTQKAGATDMNSTVYKQSIKSHRAAKISSPMGTLLGIYSY